MGHPRLSLALSAAWTAATVLLALVFLARFGFVGIALAYSVTMVFASAAAIVAVRRFLPLRLWSQVRVPLAAALLACGGCFLARQLLAPSLIALILLILGTGIAYAGILWIAEGPRLQSELRRLVSRPVAE
jgi:O-antigen/teichoic acid export membrane protein